MSASISITQTLPVLLASVDRPGDFVGHGTVELPLVPTFVKGVGRLALPVPAHQAQALIKVATRATYGRGAEAIVDPAVRRCWQIPATEVQTDDPRWQTVLQRIGEAMIDALGLDDDVVADLYKLLVYEPGGFFLEHRETERVHGMFGTLVVVLLSEHEGGALVVRHLGRRVAPRRASRRSRSGCSCPPRSTGPCSSRRSWSLTGRAPDPTTGGFAETSGAPCSACSRGCRTGRCSRSSCGRSSLRAPTWRRMRRCSSVSLAKLRTAGG